VTKQNVIMMVFVCGLCKTPSRFCLTRDVSCQMLRFRSAWRFMLVLIDGSCATLRCADKGLFCLSLLASLRIVLCCAVLCCAVLCCAVLCRAVPCCAVLCCALLCCAVLCCAIVLQSYQRAQMQSQICSASVESKPILRYSIGGIYRRKYVLVR
jgi:hypothetical protein